jgi:hypothetical protein
VKAVKQKHPDWPITAYVRPNRSAEAVKAELGVDRVITGEFGEFDKIEALSREHDIVINAGNSFTSEPVAAIAAGLKERPSDQKGKLIHISGTCVALETIRFCSCEAFGMFPDTLCYDRIWKLHRHGHVGKLQSGKQSLE